MVCKNCGKELSEGANFCSACGATCNVTPDAAQSVPNTAQADGDSKSAESALAVNQENAETNQASGDSAQTADQSAPAAEQKPAGGAADKGSESTVDAAKSEAAAVVKKAAEASRDAIMSGVNGVKEQMAKAPDNTKKLLFITLGSVVAICLLIVLCVSMGSSPKKALTAYVQGEFACDYMKVLNNSIAAKKAQKALDVYDKDDYEEEFEDLKDYYEDEKEYQEDEGIKYKVKVDIKDVEKIKKSDKEFKWAQDLMEDYYDCDADKIQQFAFVEARIKAEYYEDGDRDKDYDRDSSRTQYLLVKLGGTWYVTTFSHDDIRNYLKNYYK